MKNRARVASVLTMALCGVLIVKSPSSTIVVSAQEEAAQEVNQSDLAVHTGRIFGSEAGEIFNPIKRDKTDDYEIVIGRGLIEKIGQELLNAGLKQGIKMNPSKVITK